MSGQPLDLRSLADVETPEVLGAALKAFRRRVLRRNIWILLAIAALIAVFIWSLQPHDLQERIESANTGVTPDGAVWKVGEVSVALDDVVPLSDSTMGLHLVVIPASGITSPSSVASMVSDDGYGWWLEVMRGREVKLSVSPNCFGSPRCKSAGSFTVDLGPRPEGLGIPEDIWGMGHE